jgi:hypothetical protein
MFGTVCFQPLKMNDMVVNGISDDDATCYTPNRVVQDRHIPVNSNAGTDLRNLVWNEAVAKNYSSTADHFFTTGFDRLGPRNQVLFVCGDVHVTTK